MPKPNDRDLDNDGIFNNVDYCIDGDDDWTSNTTSDFDGTAAGLNRGF